MISLCHVETITKCKQRKDEARQHTMSQEGEREGGRLGNGTSLKAVTFAFACHICGYEIARTNFKLVSPGQGND